LHRLARAQPHPEIRDRTISEMFEAERASLVPDAGRFDGFHAVPAMVSKRSGRTPSAARSHKPWALRN
jgi:hypothetical protein